MSGVLRLYVDKADAMLLGHRVWLLADAYLDRATVELSNDRQMILGLGFYFVRGQFYHCLTAAGRSDSTIDGLDDYVVAFGAVKEFRLHTF